MWYERALIFAILAQLAFCYFILSEYIAFSELKTRKGCKYQTV